MSLLLFVIALLMIGGIFLNASNCAYTKSDTIWLSILGWLSLVVGCTLLYFWNTGTSGNITWTLRQGVTYQIILQKSVKKDDESHTNVAVLQDVGNKGLFCITTEELLPEQTGFLRLRKVTENNKNELVFVPVDIPTPVTNPEAKKIEVPAAVPVMVPEKAPEAIESAKKSETPPEETKK